MEKITFEDFSHIMSSNRHKEHESGIEINFFVDDCIVYQDSWLGKMVNRYNQKDCYWFGLTYNGLQAYDYESFDAFVDAKVFYGSKSLRDIWDSISFLSLGGGPVSEMLPCFIGNDDR